MSACSVAAPRGAEPSRSGGFHDPQKSEPPTTGKRCRRSGHLRPVGDLVAPELQALDRWLHSGSPGVRQACDKPCDIVRQSRATTLRQGATNVRHVASAVTPGGPR